MHFLENSMFVLNSYFCRESRFVAILHSKLRFLLRNSGVDSDFTQIFWGKNWRLGALQGSGLYFFKGFLSTSLCYGIRPKYLRPSCDFGPKEEKAVGPRPYTPNVLGSLKKFQTPHPNEASSSEKQNHWDQQHLFCMNEKCWGLI